MVDNLITLYEHNETEFKTNGLGSLIDAASCSVHEERNGEFELTMEYPVTGRHFSDLIMRRIIFARPNPHDNAQPFRIYSISKPINGVVSINARHISYDLDGYSLAPFDKSSLLDVFEEMNRQMKQPWNSDKPPFHFSTTKTGAASMFNLVAPCSMRAILGGSEGTILDRWPGEYEWDIWEIKYHQNRGADRGVTIEYGKNLTDLEQEESCDNCWTAVYPYYYTDPQTDDEGVTTGGLVELDEKIVKLPGTYNYSRTLILDLTSDFEEMPTQSQLRERAQQYIEDNEIGSPSVSLTVSFLPLSETTAYSKLKILEEVKLCDTVHVYFPRLNVASTAMCISTTYNVLTNKYTEIELGDAKSDLASTLAGQGNDTEKRIQSALNSNNSFLEEAIKRQTKMITGNLGGYVVLHDANGDGMPDELLIMDHENVEDAVNIWRANQAGVGHSSTGYNGDYTTGWTMDGHFNASLITVGELWANIIKVGILSDQKGYNYWNLETGEFRMAATAMVGDQTIPDIANAALNDAKQYTNASVGNFIEDIYNPKVAELQRQIDGQIETYYYDHKPTLQNEPASLWTNDTEKARHEGDLFYWKTKGYAYRFFKDGTTWKWQMVQDTDITQALEKAKDAKDTADNKRRVFVSTPVPPYDIGDLWVQGPNGDIYHCQRNKTGGAFDQGDWILASKYTDDSALNTFLTGDYKTTISNLTTQVDQKAETWFQNNDPSSAWGTSALKANHIGDMWYCTSASDTTHYGKYWLWDGAKWTEMNTNPPQAVFDKIDGKAQIFINTPTVPYSEGDLWFQSDTSDIMTCIKSRTSGSFTANEWQKRNKYIDLDTVDVGGTNMVSGTKDFSTGKVGGNLSGTYLGFSILVADTRNTSNYIDMAQWSNLEIEADTDYTLSFYVDGSAGSTGTQPKQLSTFLYSNAVANAYDMAGSTTTFGNGDLKYSGFVSGKWTRYWVTYHTLSTLSGKKSISIRCNPNTYLRICGVKFEKGNRPTDWSPSAADTETYTNNAINNQSQEFIFNKLTNNGAIQGLYMQNGQLYINASYIMTGTLTVGGGVGAQRFGTIVCIGGVVSRNIYTIIDTGKILFKDSAYTTTTPTRDFGSIGLVYDAGQFMGFSGENPIMNGMRFSLTYDEENPESGTNYKEHPVMWLLSYETGRGIYNVVKKTPALLLNGRMVLQNPYSINEPWIIWKTTSSSKTDDGIGPHLVSGVTTNGTSITGGLWVNGTLISTSSKSREVKTKNFGDRLLYCYETPHPMFGDIGSGQTDENGECYVAINPIFSETIANMEYYVFLQKEGDGDLYIAEKQPTHFFVRGTPNLKFAWEVKAHQRDYEYTWLEDSNTPSNLYRFGEMENTLTEMYKQTMQNLIDEQEAALHETA